MKRRQLGNIHNVPVLSIYFSISFVSGISDIHYSGPDLEDVRESVRQGVTKVAGRLSSLASGVMTSLQDKYGG